MSLNPHNHFTQSSHLQTENEQTHWKLTYSQQFLKSTVEQSMLDSLNCTFCYVNKSSADLCDTSNYVKQTLPMQSYTWTVQNSLDSADMHTSTTFMKLSATVTRFKDKE